MASDTVREPHEAPAHDGRGDRTIAALLAAQAAALPEGAAIAAPGRRHLTYAALWQQVQDLVRALHAFGVGRQDRVALVMPEGPEAAVALLAVSACATSAPLNPAFSADEFATYLRRLGARALLVQADFAPAARAAARAQGLPILDATPIIEAAAGMFALDGRACGAPAPPVYAEAEDVALVLHTSGTTALPKLVPLTTTQVVPDQRMVRASLSPADCCINVWPLFHTSGPVTLLTALVAGGMLVCPPAFDPDRFFDWVAAFQPTIHSSAPAMLRALLARAPLHADVMAAHRLRFILSGSAWLPPQLKAEVERTFGVPVLENYGSTETGVFAGPRPPAPPKEGSAGIVVPGYEVATVDEAGTLLPVGERGEIVVRGPGVFGGYDNDAEANAAAFLGSWFRTGDEGYIDDEGYLFLTGRLKEQINRGGEKVSPLEVNAALLAHPAVAEAAAFAMPDAALGETVAAAVVLRPGMTTTEAELRAFLAERLAPFKAPRRIVFVDAMPVTATGKVRRQDLAQTLRLVDTRRGAREPAAAEDPVDDAVEADLAGFWQEILGPGPIGPLDDFFSLGGNSLGAVRLLARIEERFGLRIALPSLFQAPTIRELATLIREPQYPRTWTSLVPIQPEGYRTPLFCVHPVTGDVTLYYALAAALGRQQPVYGLRARGLDGVQTPQTAFEEMARSYLAEICAVQPEGPYRLAGYSSGGMLAFEMAQQLHRSGQEVSLLALFDLPAADSTRGLTATPADIAWFLDGLRVRVESRLRRAVEIDRLEGTEVLASRAMTVLRAAAGRAPKQLAGLIRSRNRRRPLDPRAHVQEIRELPGSVTRYWPPDRWRLVEAQCRALMSYRPRSYAGRIVLFRAREQPLFRPRERDLGWAAIARGGLRIETVPGNHSTIVQQDGIRVLAARLAHHLAALEAGAGAAGSGRRGWN